MTDHDKDRLERTGDPGPTFGGSGLASESTVAPPLGAASDAPRSDFNAGVGRGASDPTDARGLDDAAKRTADEVRQTAREMAGRVKEQGRSMFEQQKDSAAQQVDSVAHAFRNTAGQLQGEGQSHAGRYVEMTADRLESFGRQLRQKGMDTLISDAEDMGRRAPAIFFTGSVVAGFLLARFLKSSAERRQGLNESLGEEWRSPPPSSQERYRSGLASGARDDLSSEMSRPDPSTGGFPGAASSPLTEDSPIGGNAAAERSTTGAGRISTPPSSSLEP